MIFVRLSDQARRYWAFQIALSYGATTFLLGFVIFHSELPSDPWERLFTPALISPAIASVAVVYRILMRRKRVSCADGFFFKAYWSGMALAVLGTILALVVQKI